LSCTSKNAALDTLPKLLRRNSERYGHKGVAVKVKLRPGFAGLPCFMADIEIMDDYGNIVETGELGEIVVRGPIVFNGRTRTHSI